MMDTVQVKIEATEERLPKGPRKKKTPAKACSSENAEVARLKRKILSLKKANDELRGDLHQKNYGMRPVISIQKQPRIRYKADEEAIKKKIRTMPGERVMNEFLQEYPWYFDDVQMYRFFCCPQCEYMCRRATRFMAHCRWAHKESRAIFGPLQKLDRISRDDQGCVKDGFYDPELDTDVPEKTVRKSSYGPDAKVVEVSEEKKVPKIMMPRQPFGPTVFDRQEGETTWIKVTGTGDEKTFEIVRDAQSPQ